MSEISTGLTFVDAPPVRERAGGGAVGRPSPFAGVLDSLRGNPNRWARITAQPIDSDGKETKSGSAARRIKAGLMKGLTPGEFDASYKDGHVFACYLGQAGIDAWNAEEPAREAARAARAAKKAAKESASTNGHVAAEPAAEVEQPELVSAGAAPSFSGDQW